MKLSENELLEHRENVRLETRFQNLIAYVQPVI
jgi:hypothetical protein